MGVYLPDMEMPGNCARCFMRISGCRQRIYQEYRPKGCPLVEIPKFPTDKSVETYVRGLIELINITEG